MKIKIVLLALTICISSSLYSQVKVWDKKLEKVKTKGVYSLLESSKAKAKDHSEIKFRIEPFTIAGFLIPYAIKYGNYALKKITAKNEQDYVSEYTCLNQYSIIASTLKDSIVVVGANLYFYEKGKTDPQKMASYKFAFEEKNSALDIKLIEIMENYTSVKMKNKYDLLISNFDISVSAVTREVNNNTSQLQLTDLGTTTIYKINPSFKSNIINVLNSGGILIPFVNADGKKIKVEYYLVKVKIGHANPYGTTSSSLNDFLQNNSETNEEFLNSLLIKEEDN